MILDHPISLILTINVFLILTINDDGKVIQTNLFLYHVNKFTNFKKIEQSKILAKNKLGS